MVTYWVCGYCGRDLTEGETHVHRWVFTVPGDAPVTSATRTEPVTPSRVTNTERHHD